MIFLSLSLASVQGFVLMVLLVVVACTGNIAIIATKPTTPSPTIRRNLKSYCKNDKDCPKPSCMESPMSMYAGFSTSCPTSICTKNNKCQTIKTYTKCGSKIMCSSDEYCCSESCGYCINKALKIRCHEPICTGKTIPPKINP
jgi:hypothetical protein